MRESPILNEFREDARFMGVPVISRYAKYQESLDMLGTTREDRERNMAALYLKARQPEF